MCCLHVTNNTFIFVDSSDEYSMKIALDIRKTLEENASDYFLVAKKARSKIAGAQKAVLLAQQKKEQEHVVTAKKSVPIKVRKKAWYEKFKWFYTSTGLLVIAGRDATTNEIVIKKHTEQHDIVFHTASAGSPFVVVKTLGQTVSDDVLQEVADFAGCHSKAWKLGFSDAEVFWVTPEQVTKETKSGEFMPKGSFMVYGKHNFVRPRMKLAACLFEDKIMVAPLPAVQAQNPPVHALITQGNTKPSDSAKDVMRILGKGTPDDVLPLLPSGGCMVKKG
jgi:predicted ribosome quality control (RQC) complex YloA/Tae2 family protein